jgi:hypothetical protein
MQARPPPHYMIRRAGMRQIILVLASVAIHPSV